MRALHPDAHPHRPRGCRTRGHATAEHPAPRLPNTRPRSGGKARPRSGGAPYRNMLRDLCVYLPNAVSDRAFHKHTRCLGSISRRSRRPVGMQKPPVSHMRNGRLARCLGCRRDGCHHAGCRHAVRGGPARSSTPGPARRSRACRPPRRHRNGHRAPPRARRRTH